MSVKTIASILKVKGPETHVVTPETAAYDAIAEMASGDSAAVLVMNGSDVLGVFTAADYGRRVVLPRRDGREVAVRDVMTSPVTTVSPHLKIVDAMHLMTDKKLRHLPVIDGTELVGLVTLADLVRSILSDQEFKIEQLMNYVGS